jgi:glycogen(starch) synthase
MGLEYVKARQLALRRAYPGSYEDDEEPDFFGSQEVKISRPLSEPGSPRDRSGMMTPGDFASLQEGRGLHCVEASVSYLPILPT